MYCAQFGLEVITRLHKNAVCVCTAKVVHACTLSKTKALVTMMQLLWHMHAAKLIGLVVLVCVNDIMYVNMYIY